MSACYVLPSARQISHAAIPEKTLSYIFLLMLSISKAPKQLELICISKLSVTEKIVRGYLEDDCNRMIALLRPLDPLNGMRNPNDRVFFLSPLTFEQN